MRPAIVSQVTVRRLGGSQHVTVPTRDQRAISIRPRFNKRTTRTRFQRHVVTPPYLVMRRSSESRISHVSSQDTEGLHRPWTSGRADETHAKVVTSSAALERGHQREVVAVLEFDLAAFGEW